MNALLLAEAAALALAVVRIAGFVMVAPFPGRSLPTQTKIGFILLLAFLARAANPLTAAPVSLDASLLAMVPGEIALGFGVGFVVRVSFAAAEILASSFAQATGLTMGAIFDPAMGTEDPIPARIATMLGMLLFFSVGAHRVALAYTLESFRAVPIGSGIALHAAAPAIVDFLAQVTEVGVRIALPVVAVSLAVQVTLALIARASPSLQIFSVGMSIIVAAGLLVMLGSLNDVAAALGTDFRRQGERIDRVLVDIVPAGNTR